MILADRHTHRLRCPAATRHYQIGPLAVSFTSPASFIGEAFHGFYAAYETPQAPSGALEVAVCAVRSPRTLRRHYRILVNGRPQCTVRRAASVLPHVEWAMNVAVARYLPHYYLVHAAAVSRRGAGAILAGRPGQGKTTLAAGLLARGWSYFSDEFALIDPLTRQLTAYPKTLCIKSGALGALRGVGLPVDDPPVFEKAGKGPVALLDPLAVRAGAIAPPCPVRLVLFPEYTPGAQPRLEPISRARAVYELIQVSFNFAKFRGRGLSLLADVLREAQACKLTVGDLAATTALLDRWEGWA
jgi:HprK-related kinase A